jgi:hypothetical protein
MSNRYNRVLVSLALLLFAGGSYAQTASIDHIIEVRRTFASSECDAGDIYVDGSRISLFGSDPAFFRTERITEGIFLVSALFKTVDLESAPFRVREALELRTDNGIRSFNLLLLASETFSPFRQRVRQSRLMSNQLVLGYSVLNRTCQVTSSPSLAPFNDDDLALSDTTRLVRSALFGANTPSDQTKLLLVFTDKARRLHIEFGGQLLEMSYPAQPANSVTRGDNCLTLVEHNSNTIHRTSGITYERRDEVINCTHARLGSADILETRRDIRFLQFRTIATCATVLGIPIGRAYYIATTPTGEGGPTSVECLGGSYARYTDNSVINWE